MADRQQILRIDREERIVLAPATRQRLLKGFRSRAKGSAAIIVADYAKGVIDQDLLDEILEAGKRSSVPVCVDPKPHRPLQLKGAAVLTPNRKEAFQLAGMPDEPVGATPASHPGLLRAISEIQRRHSPAILLVTLGEGGMLLVEQAGMPCHIPTAAREVYDISGAGDTVIATFVLALAGGAAAIDAAKFANRAAGVVVGKLGAATVTPAELSGWVEARSGRPGKKLR